MPTKREAEINLSKEGVDRLLSSKDPDTGEYKDFAEEAASKAFLLWINSQIYKQPRMSKVGLFERLYNNELPRKERQLFNVCLPIMSGFEDALKANLTDPVSLKFKPGKNPANYIVTPKIQAQWAAEKDGLEPHQRWNKKARDDMHNAMLSGVGILKGYAENEPEYRFNLETTNYSRFHCQPLGGGDLENHTFAGEEGIYMSLDEIRENPMFDKKYREKVYNMNVSDDWWTYIQDNYGTLYQRFTSLGLDVRSNTFSGVRQAYLCQFVITIKNRRYFVLFDGISQQPLLVEPLEDFLGMHRYPWSTWQTHEDSENFWSKSFSDDIFSVAMTISTMVNQELTNREKQNFNPRAYDPTMFTDEAKLDAASYFPDRLVPADTNMGTRKIEEGVYSFKVNQLEGTINLAQWLDGYLADKVGLSNGAAAGGKGKQNAQVVLANQQAIAKRFGFRAEPCKEAWARVGEAYVSGLKNFMPSKLAVEIIGEDGFTEEAELKRVEMRKAGTIGVEVISESSEQQESGSKKQARAQSLDALAEDQNVNSKWRTEQRLRLGEWADSEISMAMDTQTYGSKKQIAKASAAIQDLLRGKMPPIYYGADIGFLQYIQDFQTDNRDKLMKRKVHPKHTRGTGDPIEVFLIALFGEYINEYVKPQPGPKGKKMPGIVQGNMQRKAAAIKAGRAPSPVISGKNSGAEQPGGKTTAGASMAVKTV